MSNALFQYEVTQSSPGDSQESGHGQLKTKITTITCRGRLVSENRGEMKQAVEPLIRLGGDIVIDLRDLNYLDSSGLGEMLAIKVSATKQGLRTIQFVNMAPRIRELLRITDLERFFSE